MLKSEEMRVSRTICGRSLQNVIKNSYKESFFFKKKIETICNNDRACDPIQQQEFLSELCRALSDYVI